MRGGLSRASSAPCKSGRPSDAFVDLLMDERAELNVFERIHRHYSFLAIFFISVVLQIIIVQARPRFPVPTSVCSGKPC